MLQTTLKNMFYHLDKMGKFLERYKLPMGLLRKKYITWVASYLLQKLKF